jgi:hypothetical protein
MTVLDAAGWLSTAGKSIIARLTKVWISLVSGRDWTTSKLATSIADLPTSRV